ncbi:MAG: thioredoxin domain-containing protein [Candidatus Microsaccharimonas sp.]
MNKVGWIIFGVAIIGLLGGLVAYSRLSSPSADVSSVDTNAIVSASDQNGQIDDHVIGNTDSNVILIEYGDFQCPGCGGAHPQIKEVTEEYKDKVLFIFRNFPLTTIHPNARAASAAVEAAGLQGKYWEMHDLVFENQGEWESLNGTERTDMFTSYVVDLGLNKDTFLKDIASTKVNQKISFDQALGKKLNVDSTPSFYLNGKPLDDAVSSSIVQGSTTELKALLDEALGQ